MVVLALGVLGFTVFAVIGALALVAEAIGLYNEHYAHDTSWYPLTLYIRSMPKVVRWIVLLFCAWLTYHFGVGVVW